MCRHRDCQGIGARLACPVLKDWRAQKALRAIWAIEARPHSPTDACKHATLRASADLQSLATMRLFVVGLGSPSRVRALGAASVFALAMVSQATLSGRSGGSQRAARAARTAGD